MSNLDTLIAAGVIPADNALSDGDKQVVNGLSSDEVQYMIDLRTTLGADFCQRNMKAAANFIL